MKKIFLFLLLASAVSASAQLQSSSYVSYARVYALDTTCYSRSGHQLTPTPAGYQPYWLSGYFRHGSRWLEHASQYDRPIRTLHVADSLGWLSKEGKQLLKDLTYIRTGLAPDDKMGVLTPLGFAQHDSIATRMCRNFPEIFNRQAQISARSSLVPRCVKSMVQEAETIERLAGCHFIHLESGTPTIQEAMAPQHAPADIQGEVNRARRTGDSLARAFSLQLMTTDSVRSRWFNRRCTLSDRDIWQLMNQIWPIMADNQSLAAPDDPSSRTTTACRPIPDLTRYFTPHEAQLLWQCSNAQWYLTHANAPQVQGLPPLKEMTLLQDILQDADSVAAMAKNGSSLRYGHDGCLMPLTALLHIEGCDRQVQDLNQLHQSWRDYEIVPMAANLQIIFYRPITPAGNASPQNGTGDILVKFLLNEREVHITALTPVLGIYYRWQDLKKVLMSD